jgi:hypothetical protein
MFNAFPSLYMSTKLRVHNFIIERFKNKKAGGSPKH